MTQGTSGAQASPHPIGESFSAKFLTPKVRRGSVSRADLIERASDSGCSVVGITAPAGYGKTTLLAEWVSVEERPTAFLSFDRFDDDPVRLIALLASAFGQVSDAGPEIVVDVSGPGVAVLGRAAPRLASAMRTCSNPFVLLLDDLHELASPECHDVLGLVMSGVPEHSQLVVASRSQPPQLPRLRAAGDAVELTVPDLALTPTGAKEVFATRGLSLTFEQASSLIHRTEGWPVGISLAALIAKEVGHEAVSITGDDPYVADYLYQEALARLPEATRAFLRRTAVLEELSAPLCDAVVGEPGSSQILGRLEESQFFLVPMDRRREWFRYHGLFREFLRSRLNSVEPELIPELHLRAANWYESNGAPESAVEHLLQTSERGRCAELMSEVTLTLYQTGRMSTLSRWYVELGDEGIEEYPPLAVLVSMVAAIAGQTSEAVRWMAIADELTFDGKPRDGTASFESLRAILRAMMCSKGPDQMLTDASFSVDQEPTWSPWRDGALDMYAEANLLAGNRDRARELFEQTSLVAAELGYTDNYAIAESELALMDIDRGAWGDAAKHAKHALAAIDEHRMQDYSISAIAFAAGARVSLRDGDIEETNRLMAQGMRVRQFSTAAIPWLAVRARLHFAKVWLALAEVSSARHLLREISDIMHERPNLGTLAEEVEDFRQEVSSNRTRMPGRAPLTPAELRLLPYLQTHLTFPEIAERLFVSRNTVRTQVASIYRKFGAGSRAEAVEKANEVGLLGG